MLSKKLLLSDITRRYTRKTRGGTVQGIQYNEKLLKQNVERQKKWCEK